jgi:hypothetical protein
MSYLKGIFSRSSPKFARNEIGCHKVTVGYRQFAVRRIIGICLPVNLLLFSSQFFMELTQKSAISSEEDGQFIVPIHQNATPNNIA